MMVEADAATLVGTGLGGNGRRRLSCPAPAAPSGGSAPSSGGDTGTYVGADGCTYTNVDGNQISCPVVADSPPPGATAQCNDGTYSFSQHHQGTCSSHGGVAVFYQ